MAPCGGQRLVVREQQDAVLHPLLVQLAEERRQNPGIQPLDGLNLSLQVAVMGALVGSLQMQSAEIRVAVQQGKRRLQLSLEVRVDLAGGALHLDFLKAPQNADAVTQGNGGNHAARMSVLLFKGGQLHGGALRPEPDAVGGHFSLAATFFVERMVV